MLLDLMKSLLLKPTDVHITEDGARQFVCMCGEKHRFKVLCFLCIEILILKCADIFKLQDYVSG